MAAKTYSILNCAAPTTASPVKQPTGTAIRTMLQLAINIPVRLIEVNVSFDGAAAATPGIVEVFGTTVAATMSTASLAADIMAYGDPNAPANTAGAGGIPLGLGSTALTGFATAAVTEGTVANYRSFDVQQIAPTNQYVKQFPLGREPELAATTFLRVRMNFAASVNALIEVVFEV